MTQRHRFGSNFPITIDPAPQSPTSTLPPTHMMYFASQNSRTQQAHVGTNTEHPPTLVPELMIPPKVSPLPSLSQGKLTIHTAAGPFWDQCSLLWTSIVENPLLPDRDSHRNLLSNLHNLHRAVRYVISSEITLVTALDHSVIESLRIFVVEHLAHIARALGPSLWPPRCYGIVLIGLDILARKLNMRGAAVVRVFLAADELQVFVAWVDGLVEQERDRERVWGVCGYCLLQAVIALYGIFPMLRNVQAMYETEGTAG